MVLTSMFLLCSGIIQAISEFFNILWCQIFQSLYNLMLVSSADNNIFSPFYKKIGQWFMAWSNQEH